MMIPHISITHRNVMIPPLMCRLSLQPTARFSFSSNLCTFLWMSDCRSVPPMGRTYRTRGIAGGGCSNPPGPLLCTACGGAPNGPGGKSDLGTYPGTPLQGMSRISPPKGMRYGMSGTPLGGGGGSLPGSPFPIHIEPGGDSPETPSQGPHFSKGRRLSGASGVYV